MDIKRINCQIAIMLMSAFPSDFNYLDFASRIKNNFDILRTSTPLLTPNNVQAQLPPEAPRIVYQDKSFNITVMGNRIDFISLGDISNPAKLLVDNANRIESLFKEIDFKSKYRLGVVIRGVLAKDETEALMGTYFNQNILLENSEVELSFKRDYSKKLADYQYDIKINKWTRLFFQKDAENNNVLIDVNSAFETPLNLEDGVGKNYADLIKDFIEEIIQ